MKIVDGTLSKTQMSPIMQGFTKKNPVYGLSNYCKKNNYTK